MATVVGANVIERDGRIILVKEGKPGVDGQWNLPAGRTEAGETPADCARREAREEVGLEVIPDAIVGIYLDRSSVVGDDVLVFAFRSSIEDGSVRVRERDSVLDYAWVVPDRLHELDLREAYVARAVSDFDDGEWCDARVIVNLTGGES